MLRINSLETEQGEIHGSDERNMTVEQAPQGLLYITIL